MPGEAGQSGGLVGLGRGDIAGWLGRVGFRKGFRVGVRAGKGTGRSWDRLGNKLEYESFDPLLSSNVTSL